MRESEYSLEEQQLVVDIVLRSINIREFLIDDLNSLRRVLSNGEIV